MKMLDVYIYIYIYIYMLCVYIHEREKYACMHSDYFIRGFI
jgi:hypothetical protein